MLSMAVALHHPLPMTAAIVPFLPSPSLSLSLSLHYCSASSLVLGLIPFIVDGSHPSSQTAYRPPSEPIVPSKNSDVQSGDERIGGPAWCPVAFLTVFFFFFIQHRRLVKHASGQASRVGTVLVTPDGSSWVDVIPASRRSETPAADLRGPRHPWSYSRLIRLACLPRDQSHDAAPNRRGRIRLSSRHQ
ncbi:hypothetical protein BHE74_00023115 [Ensete ventricosum]|nr:hypothetical protein BHE74_00023115 [Ensete ventricosum]